MAITILDGGVGQELLRRGHRGSRGLWSAQALINAPDVVVDVHRSYVDAGARVITTNTYSTVPPSVRPKAAEPSACMPTTTGCRRRSRRTTCC